MSHAQSGPPIIVESRAAWAPHGCDSALERACEIIVDAGLAGARWAVFPEGFIPGYPAWVWATRPGDDPLLDALRAEALAGAVRVPSDISDRLCRVAQRAQVNIAVGVIERDDAAGGAPYYNTLLFINTQGQIVGKYRAPLSNGATLLVWVPGEDEDAAPADEARATSSVGGI
jgi:nitrilase